MSQKNLAQIKIYGTLWNDEESGVTAIAQQIWDIERECWVSEYPDLFGGNPGELPDIPRIDKTLTLADYAADSYEVGIRLKQIQESIDKFPIPKPEKYRGNITLTDLLLISNPVDGLMYYVYNSGNEVEGYGDENFTFNGKSYLAGSTMVYEIDHWRVLGPEENNKEYKASTFDILQNKIILPFNVNRNVAFPNTRNNAYKSGLRLFDAYVYNLTDKGYVREFTSEMGTISDRWTFMIPFASSYSVGMNEEMEYASGIMTAEQLRHLYTHEHKWDDIQLKPNFSNVAFSGSYHDLTDIPENVDVENVVKYVSQTLTESQKAQARANIGAGTSSFSGRYADLIGKPDIPDSVTDAVRYVTQSLTPAQKSQARSNIGAGTGTVTSVSVKMNGTTKGTITSSGEINLGTVLTQHQSLDGYLPLTGGTIHNPDNGVGLWIRANDLVNAGIGFFDKDGAPVGSLQGRAADKKRPVWSASGNYSAESLALLSDIPSLDNYATMTWVLNQGYIKGGNFLQTDGSNGTTSTITNLLEKVQVAPDNSIVRDDSNLVVESTQSFSFNRFSFTQIWDWIKGKLKDIVIKNTFVAGANATEEVPSQKLFVDTITGIKNQMLTRSYIVLSSTGSDKPLGVISRTDNVNAILTGNNSNVSYVKLKINEITDEASYINFMMRHTIQANTLATDIDSKQVIMNVSLNPIRFEADATFGAVVAMAVSSFSSGSTTNPNYLLIAFDKLW